MSYYDRGGGGGRDNWRRDDRGPSASSSRQSGGSYDRDRREYDSRDQQYGQSGGGYNEDRNLPSHGQRRERPPPHLTGREKEDCGRERFEERNDRYQGYEYRNDVASNDRRGGFEQYEGGGRESGPGNQRFDNASSSYGDQPRDQTLLEGHSQSQRFDKRASDQVSRYNEPRSFDRTVGSQRFDVQGPPYPSKNEGREMHDTGRYGAPKPQTFDRAPGSHLDNRGQQDRQRFEVAHEPQEIGNRRPVHPSKSDGGGLYDSQYSESYGYGRVPEQQKFDRAPGSQRFDVRDSEDPSRFDRSAGQPRIDTSRPSTGRFDDRGSYGTQRLESSSEHKLNARGPEPREYDGGGLNPTQSYNRRPESGNSEWAAGSNRFDDRGAQESLRFNRTLESRSYDSRGPPGLSKFDNHKAQDAFESRRFDVHGMHGTQMLTREPLAKGFDHNRTNEPERFHLPQQQQNFDRSFETQGFNFQRESQPGNIRSSQGSRYEPQQSGPAQPHQNFQQHKQSNAPPTNVGQKRPHSPPKDAAPAKKPAMIVPGKNNRIRVFIKNLPMDYPREEIPKYFKKIGFKAIKVNRYQPLQVFVLHLAPSPNIMDIFDVTKVNDIDVEVVDPLTMEEQAPKYLSKARYQRQRVD